VHPREIVEGFRFQSDAAATNGSRIYSELLARAAEDIEAGGPVARLVEGWEGHPILDALALRVMGAVHALVLAGRAPALAAYYPSAGGVYEREKAWKALRDLIDARAGEIRPRLGCPVQTNEVRRCAALLGGFLEIAAVTELPLRLLEVGASAGLNLLWDRYRYELGPHRWGPGDPPLSLRAEWRGPPPPLGATVRITRRSGCDVAPIDITDRKQCLRLESFVWPDQPLRLATLRAAIALARSDPPAVVGCTAGDWLAKELSTRVEGEASVLFQSIVWWYIPEEERRRVTNIVHRAGERAKPEAPLAWLRLEGSSAQEAELRLRLWPGGEDRMLARAHYHGNLVRWSG
jgi:hypothetical protein